MMRHYDPEEDKHFRPVTMFDQAVIIALADERDGVSMDQKVSDALAFLKSRIH